MLYLETTTNMGVLAWTWNFFANVLQIMILHLESFIMCRKLHSITNYYMFVDKVHMFYLYLTTFKKLLFSQLCGCVKWQYLVLIATQYIHYTHLLLVYFQLDILAILVKACGSGEKYSNKVNTLWNSSYCHSLLVLT